MARYLIHIGMPQAGSSYLQDVLFPACPGLNFISNRQPGTLAAFYDPIRHYDGLFYAEAAIRAELERLSHPSRLNVLSNEVFSASMLVCRETVAKRLARLCPGAKCLIIVRNQVEAIASLYAQRTRIPNLPSPDFSSFFHTSVRDPYTSEFRRYYYDQLVRLYEDIFGRSSVLVLPFEALALDLPQFCNRIARFADFELPGLETIQRQSNARLSSRHVAMKRVADRLLPGEWQRSLWLSIPYGLRQHIKRAAAGGPRFEAKFTSRDRALLDEIFGSGNRALSKRRSLNLDAFGYPGCTQVPSAGTAVTETGDVAHLRSPHGTGRPRPAAEEAAGS